MKLFFNRNLKNLKGDTILSGDAKDDSTPAVLGDLCVEALVRDLNSDQAAGAGLKLKRWNMAKKIQFAMNQSKEPEASIEMAAGDFAMMKTRLGMVYQTSIYGPACEAMDEATEEAEGEESA